MRIGVRSLHRPITGQRKLATKKGFSGFIDSTSRFASQPTGNCPFRLGITVVPHLTGAGDSFNIDLPSQ